VQCGDGGITGTCLCNDTFVLALWVRPLSITHNLAYVYRSAFVLRIKTAGLNTYGALLSAFPKDLLKDCEQTETYIRIVSF
jgi:hypothetical protein